MGAAIPGLQATLWGDPPGTALSSSHGARGLPLATGRPHAPCGRTSFSGDGAGLGLLAGVRWKPGDQGQDQ